MGRGKILSRVERGKFKLLLTSECDFKEKTLEECDFKVKTLDTQNNCHFKIITYSNYTHVQNYLYMHRITDFAGMVIYSFMNFCGIIHSIITHECREIK